MKQSALGNSVKTSSAGCVSVIIPAYNVAPYIAETLKSVFAQTKPVSEVIVVNDGSPDTDVLETVLQPFRDYIVYLKQEHRGLSAARNAGIRAATGDLIALLDGDDLWMPQYIEVQTEFLPDNPEYDLVYCNAVVFNDRTSTRKQFMDISPSVGEATSASIIAKKCNVFVSVTARAEALREIGFDESLLSCEDRDCWLRFTFSGHRIGYHRQVLAGYRRRRTSLSADPVWMAQWNLRALQKARGLCQGESKEANLIEIQIKEVTAHLLLLRGKKALYHRPAAADSVRGGAGLELAARNVKNNSPELLNSK